MLELKDIVIIIALAIFLFGGKIIIKWFKTKCVNKPSKKTTKTTATKAINKKATKKPKTKKPVKKKKSIKKTKK